MESILPLPTDPIMPRSLEILVEEQLANSLRCGESLSRLFAHLDDPEPHIAQIKQFEEYGDRLTAEAYNALELLPYSELVHLDQQFIKYLDDIIDGMNNTARVIDIFMPGTVEAAAQDILSILLEMVAGLQSEIAHYPHNELDGVRLCRANLKKCEERADVVYHEWRKSHRRHSTLSLISETDWTEILRILEETTDACYHSALVLERIVRYHLRQTG